MSFFPLPFKSLNILFIFLALPHCLKLPARMDKSGDSSSYLDSKIKWIVCYPPINMRFSVDISYVR